MRKIIVFTSMLLLFSCKGKQEKYPDNPAIDTISTKEKPDSITIDFSHIKQPPVYIIKDSCCQEMDSLKLKLFLAEFKIEKVRYYLNICLRNTRQDKFLKGWIRRAIE